MRRSLLALDPLAIVLFAAIGRDAHRRGGGIGGVLATAAPFLLGMAAGWVLVGAWRKPADLRIGAGVLASTVTVGMLVRNLATRHPAHLRGGRLRLPVAVPARMAVGGRAAPSQNHAVGTRAPLTGS